MIPDYWIRFLTQHFLVGRRAVIPESADLSELDGGTLIFKGEKDIVSEAEDYYPGIAVLKFGFIPIATCAYGSGDPYFINVNEGKNGALYRIYHDAAWIDDDTYDMEEAVNKVLESYSEVLSYLD